MIGLEACSDIRAPGVFLHPSLPYSAAYIPVLEAASGITATQTIEARGFTACHLGGPETRSTINYNWRHNNETTYFYHDACFGVKCQPNTQDLGKTTHKSTILRWPRC